MMMNSSKIFNKSQNMSSTDGKQRAASPNMSSSGFKNNLVKPRAYISQGPSNLVSRETPKSNLTVKSALDRPTVVDKARPGKDQK